MTAGQIPVAATATTVTSSVALQGTDTKILTSGTVSGTGASLCTDSNGGATTSGCSGGGTTTNSLTLNNSGSGAASGSTFNGASAITLSYNTIGAQPTLTGTGLARNTGASTEISGDCTTSGSNAITCTKTNGTAFGTGATATIANYALLSGATFTGAVAAPSVAINGATAITSTSSSNSQAVTCPTGGSGTQYCDAAGAWVSPSGGTSNWYANGTDTGSSTAYLVTSAMTSYAAGNAQCFIAANSNTSSNPTVNFNSLGAKTIVRAMPVNGVLTFSGSADIKATNLTCLVYDGTNFDLLNPQAATGTGKIVQSGSPTIVTPSLTTPSLGTTAVTETQTVSTGGVTANLLAGYDGTTGHVTTIAAGANGAIGPAQTTQTSGQSVELVVLGQTTCIADNTVTAGDLLVPGSTTAGRCKDSGQTTDGGISNTLQIIGKAITGGSAGASITYNTAGPGHYGISNVGNETTFQSFGPNATTMTSSMVIFGPTPMAQALTVPANGTNSLGTSQFILGTLPTATWTATLYHIAASTAGCTGTSTSMGTVAIATTGGQTWSTSSTSFAIGDCLKVVAPSTVDTTAASPTMSLVVVH
jgi:hypothetical protein